MVTGIVLAAMGGMAGLWFVSVEPHRTAVRVVARSVEAGATVSSADLAAADVAVPAGVAAVPVCQRKALVGKVAHGPLYEGAVLARCGR